MVPEEHSKTMSMQLNYLYKIPHLSLDTYVDALVNFKAQVRVPVDLDKHGVGRWLVTVSKMAPRGKLRRNF